MRLSLNENLSVSLITVVAGKFRDTEEVTYSFVFLEEEKLQMLEPISFV